jgi:coiled-coil domain-containing protein 61
VIAVAQYKTGNFKKFDVFAKMLVTALNTGSESVFVDLLTYRDLEALRARKLGHKVVSNFF